MRKCIYLILVCSIATYSSLYAQKRIVTMQDLLESKNWNLSKELSNGLYAVTQFDDNLKYDSMLYQGKRDWVSNCYYLSDKVDRIFHKEKIGKEKKGKYLIIQNGNDSSDTSVFEFITLTSDSLVLKRCFDPDPLKLVIDAPPFIIYSSSRKKKR